MGIINGVRSVRTVLSLGAFPRGQKLVCALCCCPHCIQELPQRASNHNSHVCAMCTKGKKKTEMGPPPLLILPGPIFALPKEPSSNGVKAAGGSNRSKLGSCSDNNNNAIFLFPIFFFFFLNNNQDVIPVPPSGPCQSLATTHTHTRDLKPQIEAEQPADSFYCTIPDRHVHTHWNRLSLWKSTSLVDAAAAATNASLWRRKGKHG